MEDSNSSALEFLQSLESRHSGVLDELDALNERIEKVLDEYARSRAPQGPNPTSQTPPSGGAAEAA